MRVSPMKRGTGSHSTACDAHQSVFYDFGVGTENVPEPWKNNLSRIIDLKFDQATGKGIEQKVIAAYEYLVEHYEEGDRIFLFGFSRGAYAVRILVAMMHKIGLLPRSRKHLVGAALVEFEKFSAGQANKDGEVTTPTEWKLNIDEAYTFGRNSKTRWVEIEFLGLWDEPVRDSVCEA